MNNEMLITLILPRIIQVIIYPKRQLNSNDAVKPRSSVTEDLKIPLSSTTMCTEHLKLVNTLSLHAYVVICF